MAEPPIATKRRLLFAHLRHAHQMDPAEVEDWYGLTLAEAITKHLGIRPHLHPGNLKCLARKPSARYRTRTNVAVLLTGVRAATG